MDYSPPGSSVHGISQARRLEWVATSFSRGSSQPRDRNCVSCIAGWFFTTEPPGKPNMELIIVVINARRAAGTVPGAWCVCACWSLSPIWLCDPMNCSLPGSSVHGIFQARILRSRFLGRLIRSSGSPRRRKGSGALEMEIGGLKFLRRRKGQTFFFLCIPSDQISGSVVSDSLRPHESQHARPPCPSPTPGVHWDSRPSSQCCIP